MGNENETTGQNQNKPDASATEASATLVTSATNGTDKQTPTTETQKPPATEAAKEPPATEKPATETGKEKPATETGKQTPTKNAPEKYEFKAPEGKEYDSQLLEAFTGAAKEADLSQEVAQKLIDTMGPALAERQVEQVKAVITGWTEQSKSDAEFGGEKFKENLGIAKKALDAFDPIPSGEKTTALRTLLDTSGMGNHPELIRVLYRAGKAISEDKFVAGTVSGKGPAKDATSVLYDKTAAK